MAKDYRYKGYTFRSTYTLHANSMRPLYEIDGLKDRGKRPFLTSIRACKEFIDDHLDAINGSPFRQTEK